MGYGKYQLCEKSPHVKKTMWTLSDQFNIYCAEAGTEYWAYIDREANSYAEKSAW